jgi:nitrogen fixation protein NifU and related proteins
MSELRDLYQEIILDHGRKPRNLRRIAEPAKKADGFNPLCGDKCTVYVRVDGDRLQDVAFEGSGCAISTASASIMTETLRGKSTAEAEALFERFHGLVTGKGAGGDDSLGKLEVFAGVSEFPARVKCASLAWHTLRAALHEAAEPVSTE